MADLTLVSKSRSATRLSVIFIHGLGGDAHETWTNQCTPPVFWPKWLHADFRDVSVWTVGYEAAKTRWSISKSAMAIQDRATNILELILASDKLKHVEIALVGHSMGGLIIKQMIRTADSLAYNRIDAAEFISQVRRIAFIATPHSGSGQASFMNTARFLVRPSVASDGLVRNSPSLRDLNLWYREWAASKNIYHLILSETKEMFVWGMIVKPDSSDPGLPTRPIPIDANHSSICKPIKKSSDVYVQLKKFIAINFNETHPNKKALEILTGQSKQLENIEENQSTIIQNVIETNEFLRKLDEKSLHFPAPKIITLVDAEIESRLTKLKKCRFYSEFDRISEAMRLGAEIKDGVLSHGTAEIRARALAWCARIISDLNHILDAKALLTSAQSLATCIEIKIAESFLLRIEGHYANALKNLSTENFPISRSAMFIIELQEHDATQALDWAEKSGFSFDSLDSDGRFFWITCLIKMEKWDEAQQLTKNISDEDFEKTPVLLFTAALSNLLLAVPLELRSIIEQQVPFELDTFPLADDKTSIKLRNKAIGLFLRAAEAAEGLACNELAKLASDFHLWLMIRNKETYDAGIMLLKNSLANSNYSIRRINFLSKFGLKLDIDAIEREIERQDAISGGLSIDVALARFVLALNQSNPREVLRYLTQHKKQLEGRIANEVLESIEIQMLCQSGQLDQAKKKIADLVSNGLSPELSKKYEYYLEAENDAGTEARIKRYVESSKIEDLASLVEILLQKRDWQRLSEFGEALFARTLSIKDAETFTIALENSEQYEELDKFLLNNFEIVDQSDLLLSSWSWSRYRNGKIVDAMESLKKLLMRRDEQRDRSLEVQIAIASGAWESLAEFSEKQWRERENRSAVELIHAARIAQSISAPRAKDLMLAATRAAPEDTSILMNAYILASEAGWEEDGVTSSWLSAAAAHSGEGGAIRQISLEELVNMQPDWNKRASETSQQLMHGEIPTFLAARVLNRTLLDLILANGLMNLHQIDPRRRSIISAFSGARKNNVPVSGGNIIVDTTSILTLGRLGLLKKLDDMFDTITVPHSTLAWLFEERKKVIFHQPSQIKQANYIRRLVSQGDIFIAPKDISNDPDLSLEIGEELASMISEAINKNKLGQSHCFVATSFPIHRIGSLMKEEVDLSNYSEILCGAKNILQKILQRGQITASEYESAKSYLKFHKQESIREVTLPDQAVVYFDELILIHCYHAGILKHLKNSGLHVLISTSAIARVDELLSIEDSTQEQLEIVNEIKEYLEFGITHGSINLSPVQKNSKITNYELASHPSLSAIEDATGKDYLLIDERYFNHNSILQAPHSNTVEIITSIDLITEWKTRGILSEDSYYEALTKLRRLCYVFVPMISMEIHRYLNQAEVHESAIIETAELRSLREYLLKLRMSNVLKIPPEGNWLEEVMQTFLHVLKEQWVGEVTEHVAIARSNWLWRQIDALRWAIALPPDTDAEAVANQFKMQNLLLIIDAPKNDISQNREKYWNWLERDVISKIKENYPALYTSILEWCKESIHDIASEKIFTGELDD